MRTLGANGKGVMGVVLAGLLEAACAGAVQSPRDPIARRGPAATSSTCTLASDSARADLGVWPPGDLSFALRISGSQRVILGGERDGLVEMQGPLAFRGMRTDRSFDTARAVDLAGGLVHLEPGADLTQTDMSGSRAVVTAHLLHGAVRATIDGLDISCDALALQAPDTPPRAAPTGYHTALAPRDQRLVLHREPGSAESITLVLDAPHVAVFDELDARAGYHRLRFSAGTGWVEGWADDRDLVTGNAPSSNDEDNIYGSVTPPPEPGETIGPLELPAGTPVYATDHSERPWATVTETASFEVITWRDSEWAVLTGVRYKPDGKPDYFADGLKDHAWVRRPSIAHRERVVDRASCLRGVPQACPGGVRPNTAFLRREVIGADAATLAAQLRSACDAGNAPACNRLGLLYRQGTGVADDPVKAAALFEKACTGGLAVACSNLGAAYEDGSGVLQELFSAVELYQRACTAGSADGCMNLALKLREHSKFDAPKFGPLFEKACDGGIVQACDEAGFADEQGAGMAPDERKAASHYERACDGGYVESCSRLGRIDEFGRAGEADAAKAAELYQKGCDGGSMTGCNDLARLYQRGRGVPRDPAKAAVLFSRACIGGVPKACEAGARR